MAAPLRRQGQTACTETPRAQLSLPATFAERQDQPADQTRLHIPRSNVMAKGQQKSNKEIKRPKKEKPAAAAPASFEKRLTESTITPKKKGK